VISGLLSVIRLAGSGEIGAAATDVAPATRRPAKAAKIASFDMVSSLYTT
jgi:hypothetical protein